MSIEAYTHNPMPYVVGDQVLVTDGSITHNGLPAVVIIDEISNGICWTYSHDNVKTGQPIHVPLKKDAIQFANENEGWYQQRMAI